MRNCDKIGRAGAPAFGSALRVWHFPDLCCFASDTPPIRDYAPLTTGAVVAVSIFGGLAPDFFATFDVAFFTLLLVTAGEPWPDALPRLNSDGTANWTVMVFCGCYIIISTWLVLQVPGGLAGQPGLSRSTGV